MHCRSLWCLSLPLCSLFLLPCVFAAEPARKEPTQDYPKPDKPKADEPKLGKVSLDKAAAYLDGIAVNWTRERNCGTCHTNYPFLLARPALKAALKEEQAPALDEVRTYFEQRVANWDRGQKGDPPRWDTEVVATAATLAIMDARTTGMLHPLTRQALDRSWTLQQKNGAWNWIKCDWPPMEHDDYYGAVYAALGVGLAPDGYAETEKAKAGLGRLRDYFKGKPPPDLHHKAMLLWASVKLDGLLTEGGKAAVVKELLAAQQPDGGWSLPSLGKWGRRDGTPNNPKSESDGYATGLVVFILRQAGTPANHDKIQQGVKWLQTHQRSSGLWYTRSLNTDSHHFITHIGTCYAVLALQACDALKP